jgi:hypothetical protein
LSLAFAVENFKAAKQKKQISKEYACYIRQRLSWEHLTGGDMGRQLPAKGEAELSGLADARRVAGDESAGGRMVPGNFTWQMNS